MTRRQPNAEANRPTGEPPKATGGTMSGQEKTTPTPQPLSPEAVQDIIAKVLAIQPAGMTQQQAIQVSEVITAAIPAVATSPQAQLEDDRKWSLRVSHAHEKLRYWKMQHDDRREAQRKMNRQLDDANAHIEYWQSTLEAAKRRDPNWEARDPYVGIDFDLDSLACDQEEDDPDLMDADAPSTIASLGTGSTPTELLKAPGELLLPSGFQPIAGAAFPQPPSPFPAAGARAGTTPHADLLRIAEEQRKNTIKTQGSLLGYPDEILVMAAEGGHTWESTQSAYEVAHHLYEAFRLKGEAPDLTCNPLIKRMVEIMVANNKPVQPRSPAQPPEIDTPTTDTDAGSVSH